MSSPSLTNPRTRGFRDVLVWLVAGMITGIVGVAAFGITHDILIEPIWSSLPGGIPFALASGGSIGWAFYEFQASGGSSFNLKNGALFGILLWVNLIPMTLFAVFLRKSGMRSAMGDWETVAESAIAILTGALAGWLLTRARRPTLALGVAMLCLVLVMAGPIPILNSPRAAYLFGAFLVIYPVCGVILVAVRLSLSPLVRAKQEDNSGD